VRERRGAEIEILSLVSTADSFGAEVAMGDLEHELGMDGSDLRTALSRLIAEHLIHEHDGRLGGLHELRSRHLMREVHRVPPPTLGETVERVVRLVPAVGLQVFLTHLLFEDVVEDDFVITALARRLSNNPDPRAFAATLHALRLVSVRRAASEWVAACIQEGVGATHVQLVAQLALLEDESDVLPETIQRAIRRVRDIETIDLRITLLERVGQQVRPSVARASDVSTVATMLASLGEVGDRTTFAPNDLARLGTGKSLTETRLLLEAAYAAAPELAVGIADALGGPASLLDRLRTELPWIRNARLGFDEEGRPTAEAEYAYVAESSQPPAHDAVVELCRFLVGLVPNAQVAISRAVDATGGDAGFGSPLARKAIDRRRLPSQAHVAWNRARVRAAIAAVSAPGETDHLRAARDVISLAARLVGRFSDAWARGRRATRSMLDDAIRLDELSNNLRPPPIAIEAIGPLEEGDLPETDPVGYVGNMIANNLFPNLFRGNSVAPMIPHLLQQLEKVADPGAWRLLDRPPMRAVTDLKQMLLDLHAVLAEEAVDAGSAAALSDAGRHGIAAAAGVAKRRARDRMRRTAELLERASDDAGFPAHVVLAEGEPDSYRWPSDDVLVLVEVPTVCHWLAHLDALVSAFKPILRDRISFMMAPLREGSVVASHGVKVVDHVFPDDSVRDWSGLPFSVLREELGDVVRQGLAALREVSGIVASSTGALHEEELAALEGGWARVRATGQELDALARGDGHSVAEVSEMFVDLSHVVELEAENRGSDQPTAQSLAASFIAGLNGDHSELFVAQVGMLTYCAEWDVDRGGGLGACRARLA
jgi:hypothetical protein